MSGFAIFIIVFAAIWAAAVCLAGFVLADWLVADFRRKA